MQPANRVFRGWPSYYEKVKGIRFGKNELDFLSVNVPPICNFNCSICFSALPEGFEKVSLKNILTNVEIRSFLSQGKQLGLFHIDISGQGEPFAFEDYLRCFMDY